MNAELNNKIFRIQKDLDDFMDSSSGSNKSNQDLAEDLKRAKSAIKSQNDLIKQMKLEIEVQCGRVKILKGENEQLRRDSIKFHAEQEIEEEQITNRLLKQILGMKKEKAEILAEMEKEEEFITNKLQKRLSEYQLQREKYELEVAMEQEQEFMVNKLTRQLEILQKNAAEKEIAESSTTKDDAQLSQLQNRLKELQIQYERKIAIHQRELKEMQSEVNRLKQTSSK